MGHLMGSSVVPELRDAARPLAAFTGSGSTLLMLMWVCPSPSSGLMPWGRLSPVGRGEEAVTRRGSQRLRSHRSQQQLHTSVPGAFASNISYSSACRGGRHQAVVKRHPASQLLHDPHHCRAQRARQLSKASSDTPSDQIHGAATLRRIRLAAWTTSSRQRCLLLQASSSAGSCNLCTCPWSRSMRPRSPASRRRQRPCRSKTRRTMHQPTMTAAAAPSSRWMRQRPAADRR